MLQIEYLEGNKVKVTATFKVPDENGVLTDPAAVTFTARARGAAKTAYVFGVASEVTKSSTGIYVFTFVPVIGHWWVHVQGTGAAYAAAELEFDIDDAKALATP